MPEETKPSSVMLDTLAKVAVGAGTALTTVLLVWWGKQTMTPVVPPAASVAPVVSTVYIQVPVPQAPAPTPILAPLPTPPQTVYIRGAGVQAAAHVTPTQPGAAPVVSVYVSPVIANSVSQTQTVTTPPPAQTTPPKDPESGL